MIELKNLIKSYGNLPVINDLSLKFPSGKITVLVGPSGCGKTTTLEMINGLVKPDRGMVLIDGQNIAESDIITLRRRIGYVIQEAGLFPHYTVFDNIALVPRLLKWDESRVNKRVTALLELINIPQNRLEKYPAQLSGGQQQRVGVARALAADPEYLLMDEPFSALDPINRKHLQDEFLRIQSTVQKTVVFVTHDINEALKIGDYIAVMNRGKIVQFATPLEILQNPADNFVRDFVGESRRLKMLQFSTVEAILTDKMRYFPAVSTGMNPEDALEMITRLDRDYAFIRDHKGEYAGYIEQRDLLQNHHLEQLQPRELSPVFLTTKLQTVLENLLAAPIPALAVVDAKNHIIGSISLTDLRNFFDAESKKGDDK